jgi:rhodanese-related sulfurtransferase
VREAVLILGAAVFMALAYGGITQKGIFSRPQELTVSSGQDVSGVPEVITLEEARELFTSGKAVFIDARDEGSYRDGHIQGAVNIALGDLPLHVEFLRGLSAEKVLVPYCDGTQCHSSVQFAHRLLSAGISQVKVFFGGWEEWTESGLPMERSAP